MIPILYDSTDTSYIGNGLGRLRDCISCTCYEERNGLFEVDFEYPVDGYNYDRIQLGRTIAVTHDEGGDVQPFDIVSYTRPIDGVVTFHCVHISYRQTAMTASGTNVNSLADAFTMLEGSTPANPFTYWTDKTSTGYLGAGDGVPHSVRQILGGMDGSILDSYGGEFEWDNWTVKLWSQRGSMKPFTIRYGVNLTDYKEEVDYSDTYTSVIPYWVGQSGKSDVVVQGNEVIGTYPSFNGMDRCIPLDLSDKFETKPTTAQLEAEAETYITDNQPYLPAQTIEVDFIRLKDQAEYQQFADLQKCRLCDAINVVFPLYNMTGQFKIVKTEYDVLTERYNKLELGTLATSLAESLGISSSPTTRLYTGVGISLDDLVTEKHTVSRPEIDPSGTTTANIDETKTKSGYYPLGVVGWTTGHPNCVVVGCYLYSQSSGSCTIRFRLRATGDKVTSGNMTVCVLWVKES